MINALDHIGLRITDFQQSINFYQQLGFQITRMDFDEHVFVMEDENGVTLNLLDSAITLHEPRNVLMDETVTYAGYTHIAFRVSDIRETATYIRSLAINITEGPVTFGDGKTSIFIRDPDLNVVEFTQPAETMAERTQGETS